MDIGLIEQSKSYLLQPGHGKHSLLTNEGESEYFPNSCALTRVNPREGREREKDPFSEYISSGGGLTAAAAASAASLLIHAWQKYLWLHSTVKFLQFRRSPPTAASVLERNLPCFLCCSQAPLSGQTTLLSIFLLTTKQNTETWTRISEPRVCLNPRSVGPSSRVIDSGGLATRCGFLKVILLDQKSGSASGGVRPFKTHFGLPLPTKGNFRGRLAVRPRPSVHPSGCNLYQARVTSAAATDLGTGGTTTETLKLPCAAVTHGGPNLGSFFISLPSPLHLEKWSFLTLLYL